MKKMMMASYHCVFFALTLTVLFHPCNADDGMKCSSVPYYTAGFSGEIIRSWKFRSADPKTLRSLSSNYVPRYTEHGLAPIGDKTSTKYIGLDLFSSVLVRSDNTKEYVTMKFQRQAKVYLFVAARNRSNPPLTLDDWNPEGWAKVVAGNFSKKAKLGIYRPRRWRPSRFAYVFSKNTNTSELVIKIPGKKYVANNVAGTKVGGFYWLLVAEADGSPVTKPSSPTGVPDIPAGGRCPSELHELWKAPARPGETDVDGRTFKTTHPIWDPCYWCAFDHEHGSVPIEAMGYYPRLGYVAFKNNDEPESHNGFKYLMLKVGNYLVLFGVHSQLSVTRRFTARHHSVVIVVVDAATKELLMEMGYKGDFGFAAVRIKPKGIRPVNTQDTVIKKELMPGMNRAKRVINVINPENLHPDYAYRNTNTTRTLMLGRYEQWFIRPPCANPANTRQHVVVDFKNPATALKEVGSTAVTILGRAKAGSRVVTAQQNSMNRDLRTGGIELGAPYCGYSIPNDGVFYTDKFGTALVSGTDAFRQFIKPGFKLTIKGRWMVEDNWVGMHGKGKKGRMTDAGRAIIPNIN